MTYVWSDALRLDALSFLSLLTPRYFTFGSINGMFIELMAPPGSWCVPGVRHNICHLNAHGVYNLLSRYSMSIEQYFVYFVPTRSAEGRAPRNSPRWCLKTLTSE